MHCPRCARETPDGSIVCPFCASSLGDVTPVTPAEVVGSEAPELTEAPTLLGVAAPSSRTDPASNGQDEANPTIHANPHGRFLPGTVVAERYRIVGLLGRGGMGEVYRADDLKLGQQVALKFLSRNFAADPAQVELLFDEVRMARKVSHPNVCRVWDVGEANGHHYVSMEYVDGEDLSSLLRRIGHLPEDKAIEISRQLCAALAAAHDEGILHRDLKPANIMLDGRGRVKLTDFGLAGVAEVRAGTPLYMAPEQVSGESVSVASDLYSLGLVLHELFTGRKVFDAENFDELSRQHASDLNTSMADTGRFGPAIESVIRRCLEQNPARRPPSALAVAAALPGADPLAAALAAGETPSPEMVAEAGGTGSLRLWIAVPLLLLAIVGAVTVAVLQSSRSLIGWIPFDMSPTALDLRAEEIVEELGYSSEHGDVASSFTTDLTYARWLRSEGAPEERWQAVASGRPATIEYWWRSSPSVMVPFAQALAAGPSVALTNPPLTEPGMVGLKMDTLGNLIWLDVVPDRVRPDTTTGESASPPGPNTQRTEAEPTQPPGPTASAHREGTDWLKLFELMGLDQNQFEPVQPRLNPNHFADERAAWEGVHPGDPDVSLRIEAAAFAGRPSSVRWFTPWEPLETSVPTPVGDGTQVSFATGATIVILIMIVLSAFTAIFGGLYVAQRNVRAGRGDSRGGRRLGVTVALLLGTAWFLGEHTYSPADINDFLKMLVLITALAGITWALYLAVEPFMRRHNPEALIGWTRFLDGRLADPLVGRDLLIGCAAGTVAQLLTLTPMVVVERSVTAGAYIGIPRSSVMDLFSGLVNDITTSLLLALGMSFLYSLTYLALGRRPWAAFMVWLVVIGSIGFLPGIRVNGVSMATTPTMSIFWALGWALALYILFRRGILAFLVMSIANWLLATSLPTLDFGSWYGPTMTAGLSLFLALTAYAFYRCVAWKGSLAEALVSD